MCFTVLYSCTRLIKVNQGQAYIVRCVCCIGMSTRYDRLRPSDSRKFVAVAARALADPVRYLIHHRVSTAKPRSLPDRRARHRFRRGASGVVEPCASIPISASFAGHAAQSSEVLPHGNAQLPHGSRRKTVC